MCRRASSSSPSTAPRRERVAEMRRLRAALLALLMVLGLAVVRGRLRRRRRRRRRPAARPRPSDDVDLTQGQDVTIAMVTHGDGGSFWAVAKKGAEDGAKQMGVDAQVLRVQQRPAEAGAADRRRGDREGRRPRRLGAEPGRAQGLAAEGGRRRHPDHHAELGRGRLRRTSARSRTSARPRDRRRGRGREVQGGGRQEAALRHPRAGATSASTSAATAPRTASAATSRTSRSRAPTTSRRR